MHAEVCPCCGGNGYKLKFPAYTNNDKEICNCCGGRGWVEVNDSYYPYYMWYDQYGNRINITIGVEGE